MFPSSTPSTPQAPSQKAPHPHNPKKRKRTTHNSSKPHHPPFPFLSLPPELRVLIYTHAHAHPTPSSPALTSWASPSHSSPPDHEPIFNISLSLTCKAVYTELPPFKHLLRTGAVIPTIVADLDPDTDQLEGDLYVPAGLASARVMRVVAPIALVPPPRKQDTGEEEGEGEEWGWVKVAGQRDPRDVKAWRRWLDGWARSEWAKWAKGALDTFLAGDGSQDQGVRWGLEKKIQVQIPFDGRGGEDVCREGLTRLFVSAYWEGVRNLGGVEVLDQRGVKALRWGTMADWDLGFLKGVYEWLWGERGKGGEEEEVGRVQTSFFESTGVMVDWKRGGRTVELTDWRADINARDMEERRLLQAYIDESE